MTPQSSYLKCSGFQHACVSGYESSEAGAEVRAEALELAESREQVHAEAAARAAQAAEAARSTTFRWLRGLSLNRIPGASS